MKRLVLAFTVLFVVSLSAPLMACSLVPSCNVGYPHTHDAQPRSQQVIIINQQVSPIDQLVHVSNGILRITGNIYDIRGMESRYQRDRMANSRYRRGLDTSPNTGYGIRNQRERGRSYYDNGSRQHNRYKKPYRRHRN